jgi:hypothetical protein
MYFDQQKAHTILGVFEHCYHAQTSAILETMLRSAKRGVGALTYGFGSANLEKHFVEDKKHARLLKELPRSLELLAGRSAYGDDTLRNGFIFSIGPSKKGGLIAKITVDEETIHTQPRLELTVPNETEKPWIISIPIVMLMKKFTLDDSLHCGYSHGVSRAINEAPFAYAGITKRNWLTRASEHFREAEGGSKKKFHQHWFTTFKDASVLSFSELAVVNKSYDDIMDWEENIVELLMQEGRALNMIPGGKEGIKFLHEHRMLGGNKKPSLDDIDEAIRRFSVSRKSSPNPLIRALWDDPEYATKVICGGRGRLSLEQISKIRIMATHDVPTAEIAKHIKANNVKQVDNVVKKKTYTKVPTCASIAMFETDADVTKFPNLRS